MDETDFDFAWEGASGPFGAWQHLRVAEFRGTEGISSLHRYEITAITREPAPEVDPDTLVRTRATLRIATQTEPRFRVVHGVIIEAEELGPIQGGMAYRLVLAPPLALAMHRVRCRIFLEKTTRQIIDAVLQEDSGFQRADGTVVEPDPGLTDSFTPARDLFAWRVMDTSRIDDVAARPYCVQYNESDLAFISRLLEEEGIAYHFENGGGVCLLVLSDKDVGRARLEPFAPIGPDIKARAVTSIKLGARIRPRKVSLLDYNWRKPALSMAVEESGGAGDLVDHHYPGRYPDTPDQGRPLAAVKLDRFEVEASYASGEGPCRVLSAGSIFAMEHRVTRYEGEYLVTRMEVRGLQRGVLPPGVYMRDAAEELPYVCVFECARRGKDGAIAESRFRPARVTPRPRIVGSQTAFVTAEPSTQGAEIHVGGPPGAEIGCVRLRFHWDQDVARHGKEPTSGWVRVSQVFAGAGQGAVFHPRVGVEVIVDFEDGDPDRPIVVGRVYNGQNMPPGGAPTVSTLTSMTSPGGGSYNEITFDDTAGSQQIRLHTPKDWNSEVGNNRSEMVVAQSSSSVGASRAESTGADRSAMVGANNTDLVGGNDARTIGGNQVTAIGGDQLVMISGNRTTAITLNHSVAVGGNQDTAVTGNHGLYVTGDAVESVTGTRATKVVADDWHAIDGRQGVVVKGDHSVDLKANDQITVALDQAVTVLGKQFTDVTGAHQISSKDSQALFAPKQQLSAEGSQVLTSKTFGVDATEAAAVQAPEINLIGLTKVNICIGEAVMISVTKEGVSILSGESGKLNIEAKEIKIKGEKIEVDGGAEIDLHAALIKLN